MTSAKLVWITMYSEILKFRTEAYFPKWEVLLIQLGDLSVMIFTSIIMKLNQHQNAHLFFNGC